MMCFISLMGDQILPLPSLISRVVNCICVVGGALRYKCPYNSCLRVSEELAQVEGCRCLVLINSREAGKGASL